MDSAGQNATRQALQRMEQDGSDLSKAMKLDFFLAAPSESAGNKISVEVAAQGYRTSVERNEETGEWTCFCETVVVPTFEAVVRIEEQLETIAQRYGGFAGRRSRSQS